MGGDTEGSQKAIFICILMANCSEATLYPHRRHPLNTHYPDFGLASPLINVYFKQISNEIKLIYITNQQSNN